MEEYVHEIPRSKKEEIMDLSKEVWELQALTAAEIDAPLMNTFSVVSVEFLLVFYLSWKLPETDSVFKSDESSDACYAGSVS